METAGEDPGSQESIGRLSFEVQDRTGAPIEGALLSLIEYDQHDHDGFSNLRVKTDESGQAALVVSLEPDEHVEVLIQKESFVTWRELFWRNDGERHVVVLDEAAVLFGRVMEFESQKPISGAELRFDCEFLDGGNPLEIVTDDAGTYRFTRLPVGEIIDIAVVRPGYVTHWQSTGMTVPGENHLDMVVPVGTQSSGLVIDVTSGKPLANARVCEDLWSHDVRAITDGSGRFELRGLFEKQHELTVRSPGFCRTVCLIRPEFPQAVHDLVIPMFRSCSLEGVIRDAGGAPVGEAWVGLRSGNYRENQQERDSLSLAYAEFDWSALRVAPEVEDRVTETDQEGWFLMIGLKPGPLPVVLSAYNHESDTRLRSKPVVLEHPGEKRLVESWSEFRVGRIEGTVPPVALNQLMVRWDGTTDHGQTGGWGSGSFVSPNGTYRVLDVESGDVMISLLLRNSGSGDLLASAVVSVQEGRTTVHDFRLEREIGFLSRKVIWPDGQPVEYPTVTARLGGVEYESGEGDANGQFQVAVAADEGTPCELDYRGRGASVTVRDASVGEDRLDLVYPRIRRVLLRIRDLETGVSLPSARVGWRLKLNGTSLESTGDRSWDPGFRGTDRVALPEGKIALRVDATTLGYPIHIIEGFEVPEAGTIVDIRLARDR